MNRYQELKHENNNSVNYLGDSYKTIAKVYLKKARKYAANNEDTEYKISLTLKEMKENESKGLQPSYVIPNPDLYIDEKLKELSKKYKDPDHIKGIIWVSILIIASIAWIAGGLYLGRAVSLDEPQNFNATIIEDNKVLLSWDAVEMCNEYVIYYKDNTGKTSAKRTVSDTKYVFEAEAGKEYDFYLYSKETDYFKKSKAIKITVKL